MTSLRVKRSNPRWLSAGCFLAALMAMTAQATHAVSPVVVEVFGSQGCSSCPPAEQLLKELSQEFGPSILPLNYHVTYWDNGKWRDPYSIMEATARQRAYAASFNVPRVYTPQMVVQGELEINGSNGRRARSEIHQRLKTPRPEFELQKALGSWSGKTDISFTLPPELKQRAAAVTVVFYENAPEVEVRGGENKGATMSGDFVVRKMFNLPLQPSGSYKIQSPLDSRWVKSRTGLAVLVHDASAIAAAQSLYPLE